MHTGKARDELVQQIGTKAMADIDYGILAWKVCAAHGGVVITVRVKVVMLLLRVTPEYASAVADILIDPEVFLPPVVRQARRGNIANRSVIRQGNQPVQHCLRIGIDGHYVPRIRQTGIRVNRQFAAGGNHRRRLVPFIPNWNLSATTPARWRRNTE